MGRPKGGTNKYHSTSEKLRIALRVVNGEGSQVEIGKLEGINKSLVGKWTKLYLDFGEKALENKKKPGNPLTKYQNRKSLSKFEQLEYELMKLRIENARLKKGYTNEEVEAIRQKK